MGNDYYVTNEHRVATDGSTQPVGRGVRLRRDHAAVLRPLPPAGDAHRDQPAPGPATATRRSTGCGRSGRTSCACATTACRSSASPGIRSPTRWTGTRRCARRTATSIRSGCTTWTATSARWARPTRSSSTTGATCCRPRASACRSRWSRPASSEERVGPRSAEARRDGTRRDQPQDVQLKGGRMMQIRGPGRDRHRRRERHRPGDGEAVRDRRRARRGRRPRGEKAGAAPPRRCGRPARRTPGLSPATSPTEDQVSRLRSGKRSQRCGRLDVVVNNAGADGLQAARAS